MPRTRVWTITLLVGLAFALVSLATRVAALRLPGNHEGYSPTQPIAFSHRLHAGEMGIDCAYCHFGAERSRHAGIPPAGVCMNCHRSVSAPRADVLAEAAEAKAENRRPRPVVSPEIRRIYRSLGLDDRRRRDPALEPEPLAWLQVHRVPDFVRFDHRSHVAAGVACQECHGPVETMERMRQHDTLLMGSCVECHRERDATLDCGACHQ